MHPQRLFILEKILTNALKHPNSEAVKDSNGTFTYSQLVEQAKRISTQIEEQHLCGSVINVDVGRCKERVVVLLGILMSGSFYLPLEEEWPEKRKQVVCDQAHISASAKLTEDPTLRIVPQLNDGSRPKKDHLQVVDILFLLQDQQELPKALLLPHPHWITYLKTVLNVLMCPIVQNY